MRNILIITLLLLTQSVLGQKFFDVSAYTPDTFDIAPKACIYDKTTHSVISIYLGRYYRTQDSAFRFCNIYRHDTSGALLKQYIYTPFTHDTLFEVTMLKNIRDTIRCFGNMQILGVKNYFYIGYFNNDMSIHPTSFYEYPHNDSNIIIANCMDSLFGSFYVFTTRYRLDNTTVQPYVTPYVYKLDINNFDSLKLVQIHGSGNDTQSVGTVLDCFVYNGKFKSYIQRRWDSINYLNNLPTFLPIPKIYNFDTNFVFIKNQMTDPWSFYQLTKYESYFAIATSTFYSNIKRLNNSYISTNSILFSYMPGDATRKYSIIDIDLESDTIIKKYIYPIYDQNDSNIVNQNEALIINLLAEDINHILTLYSEQNFAANRFLIHVTAVDSNLNTKWQKFIISMSNIYTPYTMTRLPNNGVAVVGIERMNMQVSKPLIFSLDSTGNLAPSSTSQVSKGTISLTVFPNPAAQQLNFKFDNQIKGTIKIQNLEGKTIQTQAINYPNTNINLHNLPSGVYIYTISSETEIILSNQFIKQ